MSAPSRPPRLPDPVGPITEALFAHLLTPRARGRLPGTEAKAPSLDGQLALHGIGDLSYRGARQVADEREWDPLVLDLRARLERGMLADLVDAVGPSDVATAADARNHLVALASGWGGPSLSAHVRDEATLGQLQELLVHRSAYQLKEADPHSWGLPRLTGEAKAAMVEIQLDEYGNGVRAEMHAELFAVTMRELALDPTYGAYTDRLPAAALATANLITLFGQHRRWRGALVGHLALFEMCSVGPMQRYSDALTRLGCSTRARRFYDVHVAADEHHQVIALDRMVDGLLADEPQLAGDVAFGASALVEVERRFSTHVLDAWADGRSSLRPVNGHRVRPALARAAG